MITNYPIKEYALKAPITVHVELTSACNLKCRHCYNYWRTDETFKQAFMSQRELDLVIDELVKNEVFHVVLTGGEPMLNYGMLVHGIKELKKREFTMSCNTNGTLMTIDRAKELYAIGLTHCLITLNSFDKARSDWISSAKGYDKTIEGIKNAISEGIKVSINMIVSQTNLHDIYETGKLSAELGAQKFHATRLVPIVDKSEFDVLEADAKYFLDELLKVNKDFGLDVGNLVPFPLCFTKERKYDKIYTHGCPAGTKMMLINANGDTHACTHEGDTYGNVFEIGLAKAWDKMSRWRSGELIPAKCKECPLLEKCQGGCRLIADHYNGARNEPDILQRDVDVRIRKEKGFYLVNTFGSESFVWRREE